MSAGTTRAASFACAVATNTVEPTEAGPLKVTLARNDRGGHLVFLESTDGLLFWLTREQAADLAEALKSTSQMASNTESAPYLAGVLNETFWREGISRTRVAALSGISRRRVRALLVDYAPMTSEELKILSELRGNGSTFHHDEGGAARPRA